METELSLKSVRAKKARLSRRYGKNAFIIFILALLLVAGGLWLLYERNNRGFALFCPALLLGMIYAWWHYDLSVLPPVGNDINGRLSRDVLIRLRSNAKLTPRQLWQTLDNHWQFVFYTNHLFIQPALIEQYLDDNEAEMPTVWAASLHLADQQNSPTVEPGQVAAALLLTAPQMEPMLRQHKFTNADIESLSSWLGRDLEVMHRPRPSFGGIGRDWAHGFTPRLNQYGRNISLGIERSGAQFTSLLDSPGVQAIRGAFSQGSSAIAMIGEQGVGKTKHAYALAQSLLAESKDPHLEHRQIISLSPSAIISAAQRPGDLEYIVNTLLMEASHAGHIILFFDDAQLFFRDAPGSFNATQILLPVVQSRSVQMIFAMTPNDFQRLKADNPAFAGLLTPVYIQEPDEASIMAALEDAATNFEVRHKVLITYEAIKETYRLSGRYEQDTAYPGKAIQLLEQSLTHGSGGVITSESIQQAIEQTKGVKAGSAAPVEAEQLLNMEDQIHQRMVNQTRAVSVVANALRRARAGVSNPKRPIGSFLFLGPTGTGKTELARSIAATYFGDETRMVRLDMSEYQQDSDVARILSGGQNETSSLILKVREQPFSVVLLDEIEKAHPNILNLLLQLLDEGQLTDTNGRAASFKDCIIICTSNAGANQIRQRIEQGQALESFEKEFTDELINSGQFKPELLNRFDEIVLFRPLTDDELAQVVRLMLGEVNRTLANQKITVQLTDAAIAKIVEVGNDPRLGARPMRRALQRAVEDTVAKRILSQQVNPGDTITLDAPELALD